MMTFFLQSSIMLYLKLDSFISFSVELDTFSILLVYRQVLDIMEELFNKDLIYC